MKRLLFVACVLSLFSCKNKESALEQSQGDINQITVIIQDDLWNGEVGDSIRKKFTALVDGLPQEEPLFNLVQHTDSNGDDLFCKNRNIIIVEKAGEKYFEVRNDDFAINQCVVYLSGRNATELIELIEQQSDSIIKTIQHFEVLEVQKNIAESPLDTGRIKNLFGIEISISSDFEYVLEDKNFIWLKKNNQNGSSNLLIYKTPYCDTESQLDNINHIVFVRDSIGEKYIHTQEDNTRSYMYTDESYVPYFTLTKLDDKKAYKTKGTWDMKRVYMSGPFVNYTVIDKENKRNIVLEGFVYAPSSSKRDMMHELEAIIKSVKFD